MPHAHLGGQSIYYEESGNSGRDAVIFAHGFLMDHEMFAPQVDALRTTYRVVTWDARGFGKTAYDGEPFSFWDLAGDCLALLDHLRIDRAVVGGMSQGGFVALRVALLAPTRVRGLILIDTEAGIFDEPTRAANDALNEVWLGDEPLDDVFRDVASVLIDHPDHDERWIAKWRARPRDQFATPYVCLATRDDITQRLGEITCPALVVHGTEDTAISMDKAEMLVSGLPHAAPIVQVSGAHAANLTNPAPVNSAIRSFLAKLPP